MAKDKSAVAVAGETEELDEQLARALQSGSMQQLYNLLRTTGVDDNRRRVLQSVEDAYSRARYPTAMPQKAVDAVLRTFEHAAERASKNPDISDVWAQNYAAQFNGQIEPRRVIEASRAALGAKDVNTQMTEAGILQKSVPARLAREGSMRLLGGLQTLGNTLRSLPEEAVNLGVRGARLGFTGDPGERVDVPGLPSFQEAFTDQAESATGDAFVPDPNVVIRGVGMAAEQLPTLAAGFGVGGLASKAAGAVGRSAQLLMAGGMGSTQIGANLPRQYNSLVRSGVDPNVALSTTLKQGAAEMVITMALAPLGMTRQASAILQGYKTAGAAGARKVAAQYGIDLTAENFGELLQNRVSKAIEDADVRGVSPAVALEENVLSLQPDDLETVISTSILTGTMGAPGLASDVAAIRQNRRALENTRQLQESAMAISESLSGTPAEIIERASLIQQQNESLSPEEVRKQARAEIRAEKEAELRAEDSGAGLSQQLEQLPVAAPAEPDTMTDEDMAGPAVFTPSEAEPGEVLVDQPIAPKGQTGTEQLMSDEQVGAELDAIEQAVRENEQIPQNAQVTRGRYGIQVSIPTEQGANVTIIRPTATAEMAGLMERGDPANVWQSAQSVGGLRYNPGTAPSERNTVTLDQWTAMTPARRAELLQKNGMVANGKIAFVELADGTTVSASLQALMSLAQGRVSQAFDEEFNHRIVSGNLKDQEPGVMAAALDRANRVGLLNGGETNYAGMSDTQRVNDGGFVEQAYQLYKALTGEDSTRAYTALAGPREASGGLLRRIITRLKNLFIYTGEAARAFDVAPIQQLIGRMRSGQTAQQAQRTDVRSVPFAREQVTRQRQEAVAREAAPALREAERDTAERQRAGEKRRAEERKQATRESRAKAADVKREGVLKVEKTKERADRQLAEIAQMVDDIDVRMDEAATRAANLRAAAAQATADGETDTAKAYRAAAADVVAHRTKLNEFKKAVGRRRNAARAGRAEGDRALRELRLRVDRALATTLDRIADNALNKRLSGAALAAAQKRFTRVKSQGARQVTEAVKGARQTAEAADQRRGPGEPKLPPPKEVVRPLKESREVAFERGDAAVKAYRGRLSSADSQLAAAEEVVRLTEGTMRPPKKKTRGGEWDWWFEGHLPAWIKMRLLNKSKDAGYTGGVDVIMQYFEDSGDTAVGFHGTTTNEAWEFLVKAYETVRAANVPSFTKKEADLVVRELYDTNKNPTDAEIRAAVDAHLEANMSERADYYDEPSPDEEAAAAEEYLAEDDAYYDLPEEDDLRVPDDLPEGATDFDPGNWALGKQPAMYAGDGETVKEGFEATAAQTGRILDNLAVRTLTRVARRLQSQVDATLEGPDEDVLPAQRGDPTETAELVKKHAKNPAAFMRKMELGLLKGVPPTPNEHLALRVMMDVQAQLMHDRAESYKDVAAVVNRSRLFRRMAVLDRGIGTAIGARLAHLQERADTPEARRLQFYTLLTAPPDSVLRRAEKLQERARRSTDKGVKDHLYKRAKEMLDKAAENEAPRVMSILRSLGLDINSPAQMNEIFLLDPNAPDFGFYNVMQELRAAKEGWKLGALVHSLAIQNLFSPGTIGANVTGNTLMAAALGGEKAFEGLLNDALRAFGKKVEGASTRDIASVSKAIFAGLVPALGDAAKAAATGYSPTDTRMGRLQKESILARMGDYTPVFFGGGKKSRIFSLVLTPLLRGIALVDEFFKSLVNRAAVTGIALQQARSEGLKMGTPKFDERVAFLVRNPTAPIQSKALTAADEATFKDELGSRSWSKQIETWVGHIRNVSVLQDTAFEIRPGVLIVPFLTTLVRLGRQAGRRSVGFQEIALLKDLANAYKDTGTLTGAAQGAKAQAIRNVTGYIIALAAMGAIGDDEDEYLLQGTPGKSNYFGPEEQLDYVRGKGETFAGVDISRLDPLGIAAVHAANVRDAFFGTEFEEGRAGEDRAWRLGKKSLDLMAGSRYFEGIRDILLPTVFGDFERAGREVSAIGGRMLTPFAGTWAQLSRDLYGEPAKRAGTDEPNIGPLGGDRSSTDAGLGTFVTGSLGLRRKGERDAEKAGYIEAWARLQKAAAKADPKMRDKMLSRANRTFKNAITGDQIELTEKERTAMLREIGRETLSIMRALGTPEKLASIDNPSLALLYMDMVADARADVVQRAKLKVSAARLSE